MSSSRWRVARREVERTHLDLVVGMERERGDPADRGDVLVLLADRLAEAVELDVARELGELHVGRVLVAVGAEGLQRADGERARRAEPGAGRDVGHRRDLDAGVAPR